MIKHKDLIRTRHAIAEIVGRVALNREQPDDDLLDAIIYRVVNALNKTPDHMVDTQDFDPEWYWESRCQDCDQPLYRYEMDLEVRWKHFTHSIYCHPDRVAKPIDDIPRGKKNVQPPRHV